VTTTFTAPAVAYCPLPQGQWEEIRVYDARLSTNRNGDPVWPSCWACGRFGACFVVYRRSWLTATGYADHACDACARQWAGERSG
jgi:hypothetical protein